MQTILVGACRAAETAILNAFKSGVWSFKGATLAKNAKTTTARACRPENPRRSAAEKSSKNRRSATEKATQATTKILGAVFLGAAKLKREKRNAAPEKIRDPRDREAAKGEVNARKHLNYF